MWPRNKFGIRNHITVQHLFLYDSSTYNAVKPVLSDHSKIDQNTI